MQLFVAGNKESWTAVLGESSCSVVVFLCMDIVVIILVSIAVCVIIMYLVFNKKKVEIATKPLAVTDREILQEYVQFYNELDEKGKLEFESRMNHFLSTTDIEGVNTEVEQLDKILVAASAIIPIFGFKDWEYFNLKKVLLYPDSFNERFEQEGDERTTLGVVGTGAYQNLMILSRHELRQGFINKTGKNNTAIHEFVHLLDKSDGAVDGVPENLVSKQYVMPWLNLMQKNIKEIMKNKSDINPYGATNEAEFFAVVSEYFFERPDLLEDKHPELYKLLCVIFKQQPQ